MKLDEYTYYLPPETVARMLSISKVTLARWRREGTGPRFSKIKNTIRYKLTDVEGFMDERS